ncbi:RsmB/NOP family class I SAM-dependent RNA methyltransferase [Methyloferula stellata]|uniref:RsmB/NOP family class I SAM-dependent RNA methyltransferase n=1 Tax=Methyloferula stellata TaxID=876270 RepID=UPI000368FC3C|nr:RsmB/NOP family class I SAM-dependent RNA methyltransferase [Methyloferula stellata]
MTPGARIAAAIEVLDEIDNRHRPASDALKDWGLSHRFAGSKDRAAIGSFVFDALRCKASAAWIMGAETSRAIVLGSLREMRQMSLSEVSALCSGEGHAPPPLSEAEQHAYTEATLEGAPPHVLGDFPEWLTMALGEDAIALGRALADRAPVDLRTNRLKGTRQKALTALAHLHAEATPLSPDGLRLPFTPDGRGPALSAEPAYVKGLVEVQDEGSQLAALLSNAKPGEQVLDLCAGGGGKTLALAALMQNKGQIYASDSDGRRLMPIFKRLERAGVRNVQLRPPKGGADVLADLAGRCDLVLVDAPCTGTGTWRRNPDAKWRIRPSSLEHHIDEQAEILEKAVSYLNDKGRLLYITCSLLRDENEAQVERFLASHPAFESVSAEDMATAVGQPELAAFASSLGPGLRLSPLAGGTDGFYIACLRRR